MNMKKLLSILMLSWAFVCGQAQQSVDMDWWREGRFGIGLCYQASAPSMAVSIAE